MCPARKPQSGAPDTCRGGSGLLSRSIRRLSALTLSVALGSKSPGTSSEVTHITVQALHDSLSANPSLLLVDVRTPAEWDSIRVQGVKKFIEHDQIGNRVADLNADTSASVYLICRRGHRSTLAAETLAKLGYKHLFNVDGGTNTWIAAGFPTDSGRVARGR